MVLPYIVNSFFGSNSSFRYVGLNGIECFDGRGDLIQFANPTSQLSANPPDINILPG